MLPTAFSPGRRSTELELRGGAALRELARAMMTPEGYVSRVTFVPGDRELENIAYSRPFDGMYFIDGMRGGQPLTSDPKYGVFPAAAAWVRQILDEKSGAWFTNYVATNRAGAQANDPKRLAEGVFGVFGVYSLYTPERTLRQTYRLKLANRVLRDLIDPKPEGTGGRLVPNPLPKGVPEPSSRALAFLQQTAVFGEEQQPVTQLFAEMARIVQAGGKANDDEVNRKARAGWEGRRSRQREANSWLASVTGLPEGSRFDALRQDIDRELGASFYKRFTSSDSTTPPRDPGSNAVFVNLTDNIRAFVREHYGGMGADGPDDYGTFGDIAKRSGQAHLGIFHDVVRLDILSIISENQRRGRLGYAISVLTALEKQLDDFWDFMKEVEKVRGQLAPRVDLQNRVQKTKERWLKMRKEPPSLLERLQRKPSGKAIQAEKAYIAAYANLVNYVREEVLHSTVKSTANAMREYVVNTRRELERWSVALLEGDRAMDVNGMLSSIKTELDRIVTTIREDQRSEDIEKLVQTKQRESAIHDDDVQWALDGVQWQVASSPESLRLTLELRPQGVTGGELEAPSAGMGRSERRGVERRNMATLGHVVEQRFGQVEHVTTVLQWCENHYDDQDSLAHELVNQTEPLTSLRPGAKPGMEAFGISVNKEVDPTGYTIELEKRVRIRVTGGEKPNNNYPIAVIDAEDSYRLTAVRTQVGLMLDEFSTWDACKEAYAHEVAKAEHASEDRVKELIQTLQSQFTQQEEKEAIALEVRWRSEGREYRVLHPRMVSLLGKRRDLEAALQCWAQGWVLEVQDEQIPDRHHWELRVPGEKDPFWLTPNKRRGEVGSFEALESLVLVGKNHARGHQGVGLNWSSLQGALRERWHSDGEEPSPLCKAVKVALAKGGLIDQWMTMAMPEIDPVTDNEVFRNPVYRDLAEYAKRYFEDLAC